jgi:hypothetical protein
MRSRYRLNRTALTATGQLSLGQVQIGHSDKHAVDLLPILLDRACERLPRVGSVKPIGEQELSVRPVQPTSHNETCRF